MRMGLAKFVTIVARRGRQAELRALRNFRVYFQGGT